MSGNIHGSPLWGLAHLLPSMWDPSKETRAFLAAAFYNNKTNLGDKCCHPNFQLLFLVDCHTTQLKMLMHSGYETFRF